jgi:hypothetical protein
MPEFTQRRRGLAGRTKETAVTRQFREPKQCPRMLQPLPAIHQNERRQNSKPDGLNPHSENNESRHAKETEDRGHH